MRFDKVEAAIFTAILLGVMFIIFLIFTGCSTTTHEPQCKCKCTAVDATFQCGSSLTHEKVEIR